MTRRRGSQAVEFALVFPILLLVASGVVDVGQMMMACQGAIGAVADGAQAGSLANHDLGEDPVETAETVAANTFSATTAPGDLAVTAVTATVGDDVILTVTGSVSFEPMFGMFRLPEEVTYSNAMRLAYPPD